MMDWIKDFRMKQRRILVTGGAGNVGGALTRRLVENEQNYVVVADNLSTGAVWKLPSRDRENWRFVKVDVNKVEDISPLMVSGRFDYVFHYAAVVGVQRTLQNPISVLDDIFGFNHILTLSKCTGVRRVFFSSSSEVYGEPVELPQHEFTTPLNSRLPYAIVKNVGEAYLRSYYQEHGLEYTIFRFFNTYGPMQSEEFVISRFISQALRGEPLTIYGDGMQTRTFCYVDDNVDATIAALEGGLLVNDVANIGSCDEITILDLAHAVKEVLRSSSKIIHLPPLAEGDMHRRCPNIDKMRTLLKRSLLPLDQGLLRTAEFITSRVESAVEF